MGRGAALSPALGLGPGCCCVSWGKPLGCHNSVTMELSFSSGSSQEMQEAGSWLCWQMATEVVLLSSGKGDGVIFSTHLRSPPSVGTWVSVSESSCRQSSAAVP